MPKKGSIKDRDLYPVRFFKQPLHESSQKNSQLNACEPLIYLASCAEFESETYRMKVKILL
jgi:hypothetical protein